MLNLHNDDQQLDSFPMDEAPAARGGCLSLFLIVSAILNIGISLLYLFPYSELKTTLSVIPSWVLYLLIFFGLLNAAFSAMVWNWKRVGVYGFAASTLLVFILNLLLGVDLPRALLGFVGIVLLVVLVRPHWKHMR